MATGFSGSSKPHREILRQHRTEFIDSIDVLNTTILDELVENNVLSQHQYTSMKDKTITNIGRASALIDHLHTRPYNDWLKFLHCLDKHGHGDLAAMLRNAQENSSGPSTTSPSASASPSASSEYTPDSPPEEVFAPSQANITADNQGITGTHQGPNTHTGTSDAQLRLTLSQKMIIMFGIDIWPKQDEEVSLGKLYTDPVLTKRSSLANSAPVTEYTEIFKMDGVFHDGKDTFLYGKTAAGKTTLVKKIAVDWAKLIHPRHSATHDTGLSLDSNDWIKDLTCVILLDLSKIKQRQNLAGAIEEQLEIEKEKAESLVDLVRKRQEKTLLILDSLNAYTEATSKSITEIIHRKQMPSLTLLLTSRCPRSFHFRNQRRESEFILQGFSDDGIKYFTEKYLTCCKNGSEKRSILKKIMESSCLKELACFPALLGRMVSLFTEETWRSKNNYEIYWELIVYLCGRCNEKFRDPNRDKLKKILLDIGSIAVASVGQDGMRDEFTYKEVRKVIEDEERWRLGFLYHNSCQGDKKTFSFINVSIQQYFIAYYMTNTNKQAQTENLIKFCRAAEVLKNQKLIFEFVSDMGDTELRTYMARIISNDRRRVESQLRIRELNLD